MTTWSLVSAATGVSASPNTQLVLARLAVTTAALGTSSAYAWPYTLQLPLNDGDVAANPYFDNPFTDPVLPRPPPLK